MINRRWATVTGWGVSLACVIRTGLVFVQAAETVDTGVAALALIVKAAMVTDTVTDTVMVTVTAMVTVKATVTVIDKKYLHKLTHVYIYYIDIMVN